MTADGDDKTSAVWGAKRYVTSVVSSTRATTKEVFPRLIRGWFCARREKEKVLHVPHLLQFSFTSNFNGVKLRRERGNEVLKVFSLFFLSHQKLD